MITMLRKIKMLLKLSFNYTFTIRELNYYTLRKHCVYDLVG